MFSFKRSSILQKNMMSNFKNNVILSDFEKVYFKCASGYYLTFGTVMSYYHF